MRIIKGKDLEATPARIEPMVFPVLPEGGIGDVDGNGGAAAPASREEQEESARQPEVDMEQVRREAEQVRQGAQAEAEKLRSQAQAEVEQFRSQAMQEIEQFKSQAQEQAESNKKEAYSKGYSSGEEEGYKKGYEDGYTKGKNSAIEETRATVDMLSEVVEQLKEYHTQILSDSQSDIARMAVTIARKVLQKEIMTDPMTVVNMVRKALSKVRFKKNFVVHVNPLDLEVIQSAGDQVKEVLDNCESIEFKASPKVQPGGCVVQTESGNVDAQIDRQVDEVEQAVMKAMGEGE